MNLKRIMLKSILMILTLSFAQMSLSAKDHVYVIMGANGDGSSWNSAFGKLQQAVDSAEKKGADVWVAKGVYQDSSSSVVILKPNVSLYGGFAGTETSLSARDTAKNPTILDGNFKVQVINQKSDFTDASAVVVDGFTIQNGTAVNGGGVNISKNATINNCIIKNNTATSYGTAIYAVNGAVIKNSVICNNTYSNSVTRTVYLNNSKMDSCILKGNRAYYYSVVYAENNSKISNCIAEGNENGYLYNRGSSLINSQVFNSVFRNNSGISGGIELSNNSKMTNYSFNGNKNLYDYLLYLNGNSVAEDCQFENNTIGNDNFIYLSGGKMNRCKINGNTTTSTSYNRLIYLYSSTISNTEICGNNITYSTEPLYLERSTVINCTFANNNVSNSSAFVYLNGSTLKNSIIVGNQRGVGYSNSLTLYGTNAVSHNMIEGTAVGNDNVDGSLGLAAFVSPENGDYSLSEKSYCINAGVSVADTLDLQGNARTQAGAVDMGAIESSYQIAPEFAKLGEIVYVKAGSDGDGTSWNSAFGDIQKAIVAASFDEKKHQIWVAAGTYYGDSTLSSVVNLARGISLYGGFAGSETSLSARDTAQNPTILDGKKARRVISQNYAFPDSMSVVVDGFTVQNGTAVNGGGINLSKNAIVNNCIIKNNTATSYGTAIYAVDSAVIKNSVICDNTYSNSVTRTVYLNNSMMDSCILSNNLSSI